MRLPHELSDTEIRLIDAAIDRFGREGFDANLRAIAGDAGVSAATIVKRFGSKEGLRRACDDRMLAVTAQSKSAATQSANMSHTVLEQIATIDEYQPVVRYLMRSLMSGGEAARTLIQDLNSAAVHWIRDGVAAGNIRPAEDEAARAKLLIGVSLGWMLQSVLLSGRNLGDLDAAIGAALGAQSRRPGCGLLEHSHDRCDPPCP